MFVLPEEGSAPIRATCIDVLTRNDRDGLLRAYLAIKDPRSEPVAGGDDALSYLVPEQDFWLFGVEHLYEIQTTTNEGSVGLGG